MSTPHTAAAARLSSGIVGLDTITRGGLFRAGLYVVVGRPGSGKTTLANQVCFSHARQGGRAVYVTLLSETHGRMLMQMQGMSFFDASLVGDRLLYVNGFSSLEAEGLAGLLRLLRGAVRDHKADLLVLDGIVTASALAKSNIDYKKFINELQTWVSVIGCTVLFLTTGGPNVSVEPEYTMVDGILELRARQHGLRRLRQLCVRKFRGSAHLEGSHPYQITSDGLVVYPRVEAQFDSYPAPQAPRGVAPTGVPGLDDHLGGGYPAASSTLLVGKSGVGKTSLGLQFLAEGARRGERGLVFGFYETPADLMAKAAFLGQPFERWQADGLVDILWQPPAEQILDALAYRLVTHVRTRDVKRVFIDGLVGFKTCVYVDRLAGFLAVLLQELRALGVTTVVTEEGPRLELPGRQPRAASALFDNVLLLKTLPAGARVVHTLAVSKARNVRHPDGRLRLDLTDGGLAVRPLETRAADGKPSSGKKTL
jgi:circadian clock protein KaiC